MAFDLIGIDPTEIRVSWNIGISKSQPLAQPHGLLRLSLYSRRSVVPPSVPRGWVRIRRISTRGVWATSVRVSCVRVSCVRIGSVGIWCVRVTRVGCRRSAWEQDPRIWTAVGWWVTRRSGGRCHGLTVVGWLAIGTWHPRCGISREPFHPRIVDLVERGWRWCYGGYGSSAWAKRRSIRVVGCCWIWICRRIRVGRWCVVRCWCGVGRRDRSHWRECCCRERSRASSRGRRGIAWARRKCPGSRRRKGSLP